MVICIQGGLIQEIYSDRQEVSVAVIDWDVWEGNDEDSRITRAERGGRRIQAHVGVHPVSALANLEGSDAEAILLASQEDR